jgi:hypothetical protein
MATADQIQQKINSLPANSEDDKNTFQIRLQSLIAGTGVQGDNLDTLLSDVNNVLNAHEKEAAAAVVAANGDGGYGGRRRKYSRRGRRSAKKSGGTRRKQKRRQRRGSRRAY